MTIRLRFSNAIPLAFALLKLVIRAKSSELFLDLSRMAGNRALIDDDDDFDDFDDGLLVVVIS